MLHSAYLHRHCTQYHLCYVGMAVFFYNNHHNCTSIETTWPINIFAYPWSKCHSEFALASLFLCFNLLRTIDIAFTVFIAFYSLFSAKIDPHQKKNLVNTQAVKTRASHNFATIRYGKVSISRIFIVLLAHSKFPLLSKSIYRRCDTKSQRIDFVSVTWACARKKWHQ